MYKGRGNRCQGPEAGMNLGLLKTEGAGEWSERARGRKGWSKVTYHEGELAPCGRGMHQLLGRGGAVRFPFYKDLSGCPTVEGVRRAGGRGAGGGQRRKDQPYMASDPPWEVAAGPGERDGRLGPGWLPRQPEAGMRCLSEMEGLACQALLETFRTFHILKNKTK